MRRFMPGRDWKPAATASGMAAARCVADERVRDACRAYCVTVIAIDCLRGVPPAVGVPAVAGFV